MRNKVQKQPLEVFCKKDVLKNFAKSTGKRLCQSLFFNRVVGLRSATLLKKKLWHRCFPVNFAKFLRTPFVQKTSGQLLIWTTASETSNTKYLELIKRRSKVQEKNMSCERALNFDQWKSYYENYKLIRVWLWLVYKFTENWQIYRLFSEFIQTKKRYPNSLEKQQQWEEKQKRNKSRIFFPWVSFVKLLFHDNLNPAVLIKWEINVSC